MNKNQTTFQFPYVSMEQVEAFDFDNRETWTESRIVNAVADACNRVRPLSSAAVSRFLGLDQRDVTCGLRLAMGLNLQDFIAKWRKLRFKRLLSENPSVRAKEMVEQLGFSGQGALWNFLINNKLIEPLSRHSNWAKNQKRRQEAEQAVRGDVGAELRRRKWEEMTKNNK